MADEKKYLDKDGVSHLWLKIKSYCSENFNKYVHPTFTAKSNGLYKVAVNGEGHVSDAVAVTKADITALGIPAQDTTYSDATTEASGLMSASDKTKLNGVQEGAEKNVVTEVSISGAGSADLMKVTTANGNEYYAVKVDSASATIKPSRLPTATQSSKGVMSAEDKTKLDALPTNATLQSTYALKSDITGLYKYKGSVSTESNLPTNNNNVGDVYNIVNASSFGGQGMNVVWTGNSWDALGEMFSIESITSTELDSICV